MIGRFHKNTTDSDSECCYVANLVDFNVIRVIVIVIKIVIIVIIIKFTESGHKCTM